MRKLPIVQSNYLTKPSRVIWIKPKKKKSKKIRNILIILILILILISIAGIFLYFYFSDSESEEKAINISEETVENQPKKQQNRNRNTDQYKNNPMKESAIDYSHVENLSAQIKDLNSKMTVLCKNSKEPLPKQIGNWITCAGKVVDAGVKSSCAFMGIYSLNYLSNLFSGAAQTVANSAIGVSTFAATTQATVGVSSMFSLASIGTTLFNLGYRHLLRR